MRHTGKFLSMIFLLSLGIMMGLIISGNFDLASQKIAQEVEPGNLGKVSIDENFVNQLNQAFVNASQSSMSAVVTISTTHINRSYQTNNPLLDDFFRDFFNMPQTPRESYALGSGVIVDQEGHIITNYHVVAQADKIKVSLWDNRELDAKLISKSEEYDIAVLKIDADNLKPIRIGNSDEVRIGEWVMAIGSPFSEKLKHTVTEGIISAKGRNPEIGGGGVRTRFENYLQTSAPINPGNSGGALINLKGELIGINTAIISNSGGNQGIGFAIPINNAMKAMKDLVEKGRIVRAWLGVSVGGVSQEMAEALKLPSNKGAIIQAVVDNSPASKAKLQPKDVIVAIDDQNIEDNSQLVSIVGTKNPNEKVKVDFYRDGKKESVEVKLEEFRDELAVSGSIERSADKENESASVMSSKFGIQVSDITPALRQRLRLSNQETGIVITEIDPHSSAAVYGLREGDLIKEISDQPIRQVADFREAMKRITPDKSFLILIKRAENAFYLAIKIPKE